MKTSELTSALQGTHHDELGLSPLASSPLVPASPSMGLSSCQLPDAALSFSSSFGKWLSLWLTLGLCTARGWGA